MIYPNGHIDYLMYENGGALIGVAKVTMPPIKYKTVTATGAALMGDVTIPLASMIEAMTINIEFSSVADAIVQLGTNEWHDVALYLADQYFDGVTRLLIPDNCKTATTANTRYETVSNRSYQELAEYYGTAIIPARIRKPQDKSAAECCLVILYIHRESAGRCVATPAGRCSCCW